VHDAPQHAAPFDGARVIMRRVADRLGTFELDLRRAIATERHAVESSIEVVLERLHREQIVHVPRDRIGLGLLDDVDVGTDLEVAAGERLGSAGRQERGLAMRDEAAAGVTLRRVLAATDSETDYRKYG